MRLALPERFNRSLRRATSTVHDSTRSEDASLHQRQITVNNLFEASGSGVPIPQIGCRSPRYLLGLASARVRGEVFFVFVGHILPLISIGGVRLFARDVGPSHRVFAVKF